ncbi:MAG TPA: oligopeptide/dipeptide ABC transporter ATP-binding protein [Steroidobacteraceae bacterium]|jgi:oligopeptide transport system ATP-binding protein|nr:oligopeptide/dipeptide ABC transporter ATP-binding protein [Steroidobacteraceae bacterium]
MSDAAVPLLQVRGLRVNFGAQAAVRDVNFDLFGAETVGLVGESGSGKSTLARAILRLLQPARGRVEFMGVDLGGPAEVLRAQRRNLQIVFQDPPASLNPRMSVGDAIAEPLKIFEPGLSATRRREKVAAMLDRVGLSGGIAARYPHEFSGGQCQRIAIARAMVLNPKLLICDEAVSSLDVSIQGQIVNLLLDLQREFAMAMLFISHNLAIVRHLSHRVMVMYLGRLVETASGDALFAAPRHPYTRALLAAVPRLPAAVGGELSRAPTETADMVNGSGCAFRNRCPFALPLCARSEPPLAEIAPGHAVACHRSHEMLYPLS